MGLHPLIKLAGCTTSLTWIWFRRHFHQDYILGDSRIQFNSESVLSDRLDLDKEVRVICGSEVSHVPSIRLIDLIGILKTKVY
jgi:hypothetical protein